LPTAAPSQPALTLPVRLGDSGRFELRPAEHRLLADGQAAPLGGRAFDLLMALAARPQVLLTKGELLDLVWPGLVVEEGNLRVQINTLRRLLGEDAITTVPGRGYRLSMSVHPVAPGPPVVSGPAASGTAQTPEALAVPPPLIGREADLDQLHRLLDGGPGCVSVVGTPGVGKSSLARAMQARWGGPSAWVDLAPLTQGSQVPAAIARALGGQVDEGEPLPQLLRLLPADGATVLVVLDNAEHLVDASAQWATALGGIGRVRLLVTSQLPLAVAGERVWRLMPLSTSGGDGDSTGGALALIIDRIRDADRRFQPTPTSLPLLRAICRQLDGLPLALEMAAARVPLMGVRGVHDALAERFALLSRGRRDAPARHRTLHDALDWSYGLLGAVEQRLFRSLGVFAGGFTLSLAESLNTDEHIGRWDVIDGLATLVERSLVGMSNCGDDSVPRYHLLETMRAYALAKLSAPGAQPPSTSEATSLRRRHATTILALFKHPGSSDECLVEMDNAREAFLWTKEHEPELAAQLSARVAREVGFTIWRQEVTEWMLSLRPIMQDVKRGRTFQLQTQAFWWSMLAYVLNVRRDPQAQPAATKAVAMWRQLDSPDDLQAALGHLVRSITTPGPELSAACAELRESAALVEDSPQARLRVQGALAEAARVAQDSAALLACREQELLAARELGWDDMAQAAETNVCAALIELGRFSEAAERGRALLQRLDAHGSPDSNGNLPWLLNVVVESLVQLGDLAQARTLVHRTLTASQRFGTTVGWQGVLMLVLAEQRIDDAARLLGHVRHLWTSGRSTPDRDELARHAIVEAAARTRLGTQVTALAGEGERLTHSSAAALAARTGPL
jgi:predicted ATPase/DNA-binding winged helix-turn-helix (wHTH) protein